MNYELTIADLICSPNICKIYEAMNEVDRKRCEWHLTKMDIDGYIITEEEASSRIMYQLNTFNISDKRAAADAWSSIKMTAILRRLQKRQ